VVRLSARLEELKIPLREPERGVEELSGILGIPEWWPTGSRVGVVLGHTTSSDLDDPLIERIHAGLTDSGYLTLRFNFPFAEAGKSRPDAMPALKRAYKAAIATLGRDPTATPAHLILGGHGLGARVAAEVAIERLRIEGLFFLGYPLHALGKPETVQAENLYRIISPMLFLQGTRDRGCDEEALRKTLLRIGAPTALHMVQEADNRFKVLKKSPRTSDDVYEEVIATLNAWIGKILAS
jgi:predicted alpha/beta-hydrolase family hydrolase